MDELWREPVVIGKTGISRTTIWRLERAGEFPPRRRIGANAVGWLRSEVVSWMRSRPVVQPMEHRG